MHLPRLLGPFCFSQYFDLIGLGFDGNIVWTAVCIRIEVNLVARFSDFNYDERGYKLGETV